jgi:hypothetical protein
MVGERVKNGVRIALRVKGREKVVVKASDGVADGPDGALRRIGVSAAVLPLKFDNRFQFSERFSFFGLGGVGVEDSFELFFFAVEAAHGFAVVEGEAAFLEPGVAFERDGLAGGLIDKGWEAELLAVDLGDFGHEIERVDRVVRWIVQEPGDVEDSFLVANVGFFAVEDEMPDAQALSQGVAGRWAGSGERGAGRVARGAGSN